MSDSRQSTEFFNMVAKVMLRCWVFGFVLLVIWLGVILLAGDFVHRLHESKFGLSKHELDLIFYCGMGLLKLLVLVFFFIPWLAIRLMLRGEKP